MIRLLVADVQRLYAEALGGALTAFPDLEVAGVHPTTGPDTLATVEAHDPDVAVVSYALGEMQGEALVRALLARRPRLSVIMLSWLYGPRQVEEALSAGAVGCLSTRVGLERLAEGIRRAAGGEVPIFAAETAQELAHIEERAELHRVMQERFSTLTPRELEVLRLIAGGLTAVEIARRLGVTERTARTHIYNMMSKTGTHSQVEVLALARDQGLVR